MRLCKQRTGRARLPLPASISKQWHSSRRTVCSGPHCGGPNSHPAPRHFFGWGGGSSPAVPLLPSRDWVHRLLPTLYEARSVFSVGSSCTRSIFFSILQIGGFLPPPYCWIWYAKSFSINWPFLESKRILIIQTTILQLVRPPSLTPLENHQLGLWIRICHIILTGECACLGDGGAAGYGGGFIYPLFHIDCVPIDQYYVWRF